jgi:hypothetical protein
MEETLKTIREDLQFIREHLEKHEEWIVRSDFEFKQFQRDPMIERLIERLDRTDAQNKILTNEVRKLEERVTKDAKV